MTGIERKIAAFLHEEADRATLSAGAYERVLRRAKIRRVLTASVAGVAVITLVMAGVVTAGALRSPSTTPPAGPGESPTPQDQETGPESVVGQGTVSGQTWTLVAYESGSGLCVDLQLGSGSGGGCGFDVPEKHDLGLSVGSQAGLSRTIIHGVVSKRVAKLVVKLDGGEQMEVPIIQDPRFDVNFFADFLAAKAEGIVEARDDEGAPLQQERLRPLSELREQEPFTEEVLDDRKLTVYYPEGWNRASESLTPNLDQPKEVLSLGTFQLRPGGEDCAQIPERAIESLGSTDAFITLQESAAGSDFPRRPKSFSAKDGEVPDSADCLNNAEDVLFRMLRFRDEGRSFIVYVAIGDSTSAQTRNEVWQILNALIFCDPASPPGDCL
jgi:hypothetical protein